MLAMDFSLLRLALFLFCLLAGTRHASALDDTSSDVCKEKNNVIFDLITWIEENGGLVHNGQRVDQDNTSPTSIVANTYIPKDTLLLSVPWNIVLESDNNNGHESDTSSSTLCEMVDILYQEMMKEQHESSDYGPYIRYLESLPNPPAGWSHGGKELLKAVLGDNLLPDDDEIDEHLETWMHECKIKPSLVIEKRKRAALLAMCYSFSDSTSSQDEEDRYYEMIPFYDVYSPRKDSFCNTIVASNEKDHVFTVTTSRDIQPGETIYTPIGVGVDSMTGARRQFIHSGRLERHYSFSFTDSNAAHSKHFTNQELNVEFDLDKVIESDNKSVLCNITWTDGLRPNSRAYNHIEQELVRMKKIVTTVLPIDSLYALFPATNDERNAIHEYGLALVNALSALSETRFGPRPVTRWTLLDYEVAGVNLGTYNLAGIEEAKGLQAEQPPFELFEDFDIGDRIIGNENWKDMIEYRRQLERPSLCFYVDKVARKRWLPTQGMPQAKQHVLQYGFELSETNDDEDEKAKELYKLIPEGVDYVAKPSHHSEGASVWLVSHDTENNITSVSSSARQLYEDEAFDKMNVAKSLTKHLYAEAAKDESWILKNVKPGIVVEERFVEVGKFDRAPIEFCCFVIWGRIWVVQMNRTEGRSRYAMKWLRRDGSTAEGARPEEMDYVDWPRIVHIAETLSANKDMFRVDIFVGLPAGAPSLKGSATRDEQLNDIKIAVNECELYPTSRFKKWPQLAQDGARLWVAGYKMGNYKTVPNTEIPKEFLEHSSLPEP